MRKRALLAVAAIFSLGVALPASPASSQSLKDQLVGTWIAVSTQNKFPNGKTENTMGEAQRGILMFDAGGHFAFINMRASLPKFASNNRMTGTAEENKAVIQGSIAYYGSYTVDEANRTLTTHVEGSTFPNFDGGDQKRSVISLTADELKYTNPVGSVGAGVVVESVWKRAK